MKPKAYTLKIRGGIERDCYGKKAGKGALIQEERSATLGASNDQYLFQPLNKSYGFCPQVGGSEYANLGMVEDKAPTLTVNQINGVVIMNPHDSQGNQVADADGVYPTLRGCGGAGYQQGYVLAKTYDSRGNGDGDVASTITGDHEQRVTDYTNLVCEPVVFDGSTVTNPTNKQNPDPNVCHTLNTDSRNILVMATQQGGAEIMEDKSPCITASAGMSGNNQPVVAYAWDGSQTIGTLTQHNAGGSQRMPDKGNFNCIICLEGNGKRPSHKGKGYSEDGVAYTLNTKEKHAIVYAIDQQGGKGNASFSKDVMPTILSDSHGTPHAVACPKTKEESDSDE